MKKMLGICVAVSMVALLAACGRTGESKPAEQEGAQQQAPETPPPAATTSPEATPAPPAPKEAETPPPAQPKAEPAAPAASAESKAETPAPEPPVKVKKAGLGVIFAGNIEHGTFRVKADNDLIYELAFSGKDTRAEKEFYLEPGSHVMKFVVIDDKGVRGVKEETMNFVSGRHETVRVSVKDTPGAIVVEHLP